MPQEPVCAVRWYTPSNIAEQHTEEQQQSHSAGVDGCPSTTLFVKVKASADLKTRLRQIGACGNQAGGGGASPAAEQQTSDNGVSAERHQSAANTSKPSLNSSLWSSRMGDFQLWAAINTRSIANTNNSKATGKTSTESSSKDSLAGGRLIAQATGQLLLEPLAPPSDGERKASQGQKSKSLSIGNPVRASSSRQGDRLNASQHSTTASSQAPVPKLVSLHPIRADFFVPDEDSDKNNASETTPCSDELEVQSSADSLDAEGERGASHHRRAWHREIQFLLKQLRSEGGQVLQSFNSTQEASPGDEGAYLIGPSGSCFTLESSLTAAIEEKRMHSGEGEAEGSHSKKPTTREEEGNAEPQQATFAVELLLKPLCRQLPEHMANDEQIQVACKPPPVSFPSNVDHPAYCCSATGSGIFQYGGLLQLNVDHHERQETSQQQQSQRRQHEEHFSRRLYKLSPSNGRLVVLPNRSLMMPPGLAHHSMVCAGEKEVLVFGGFLNGALTTRGTDTSNSGRIVAVNDNITDAERQRRRSSVGETTSLSSSGGEGAAAASNTVLSFWKPSTLYPHPPEGANLHSPLIGNGVYSYTVDEGRWTHVKCLGEVPTARYDHSASLAGEYMIVAGGRGETDASTTLIQQQLYLLHIKSFVWVRLETAPLMHRMAVATASTNGALFGIVPLGNAVVALGSAQWTALPKKGTPAKGANQQQEKETSTGPTDHQSGSSGEVKGEEMEKEKQQQQPTEGWWRTPIAVCDRTQMGKEIHVRKTFLLQAVSNAPSSENPAAALTGVVLRSKDEINTTVARLTYEDTLPLAMQDPRRLRVISMRKEQSKRPDTFAMRGASPQEREVACQELIERLFDPKHASRREAKTLKIIEDKEASRHEELLRQKGRSTDIAVDHEAFIHKFYTMEVEKKQNKESKRLAKLKERPYQSSKQQQAAVDVSGLVDRLFDNRAAKARQAQLLQKYTTATPPPTDGHSSSTVKGSEVVSRLIAADQRHLEHQKTLYEKYVERPRSRSPKKKGSKPTSPTSSTPTAES